MHTYKDAPFSPHLNLATEFILQLFLHMHAVHSPTHVNATHTL